MNQHSERIQSLRKALPQLDWCLNPTEVKKKSLDYYWFSPVLRRQLEGKLADAVVRPRNVDELRDIVSGCVLENLPLTMRGGGTGNYGQAIPLEGGVVIDMTAFDQLLWLEHGVVRAQAASNLEHSMNSSRLTGGKFAVCRRLIVWPHSAAFFAEASGELDQLRTGR
jgi:FAD/FMN-containing dehydrogenase